MRVESAYSDSIAAISMHSTVPNTGLTSNFNLAHPTNPRDFYSQKAAYSHLLNVAKSEIIFT